MSVNIVLSNSSRVMCPFRETLQQALQQCQHTWEGYHIQTRPPYAKIHPLGLCHESSVRSLRGLMEKKCYHHRPTFLTTYPGYLPLPELAPLPRYPPPIHHLSLMPLDETRGTNHCLRLSQVRLQFNPLEHANHRRQSLLFQ